MGSATLAARHRRSHCFLARFHRPGSTHLSFGARTLDPDSPVVTVEFDKVVTLDVPAGGYYSSYVPIGELSATMVQVYDEQHPEDDETTLQLTVDVKEGAVTLFNDVPLNALLTAYGCAE